MEATLKGYEESLKSTIKDNIVTGPPLSKVYHEDVVTQFYNNFKNAPNNNFLIDAYTGEKKTGRDLLREVRCLSINLRDKLGLKTGDVVAISSENSMEMIVLVIAVWAQGATASQISSLYTVDELKYVLNIAAPKVIFCGPKILQRALQVKTEIASLETLVTFHADSGHLSYAELMEDPREDVPFTWAVPVPLDSVASLYNSSGTTGLSKCVELTYLNMYYSYTNMARIVQKRIMFGEGEVRVAAFLPLYHAFGFLIVMDCIVQEKTCVIFSKFEFQFFLKALEQHQIKELYLVPPVMVLFAKDPLVDQYNLSHVLTVRYGAAPANTTIIENLHKRLPHVKHFLQGYGLTEISLPIVLASTFPYPIESCGLLVPGAQCKVIDIETGQILGTNEEGELCFRGELVMKGYRGDPGATAVAIDAEGWLHTGDIGRYDEHGWFYVVGRIKELIKYKAMQVSPTELESILLKHVAVKDVAVWGRPDEFCGELPMAFIVLQQNATETKEDLQTFVADQVSPHKKLRGGIQFVSQIPKSAAGKILRRELHKNFDKSLL